MGINARALYATANDAEDPFYVKGNWYGIVDAVPIAGAVLGANFIRMVPFRIRAMVDIANMGCRITTLSVAGFFQLGIYRANANTLLPTGRPIANTASLATDLAQNMSAAPVQGRVRLDRGLYWWATVADNATVIFQASASSSLGNLIGGPTQDLLSIGAANYAAHRYVITTALAWSDLSDQTVTTPAAGLNWSLGQFQVAP